MKKNNKKVYVGLSGGVDSSVSALLLKKQGFEVTGVFIRAWYPDFLDCDWRSERRDAMRVCAKLQIPFLECDLEKEYKKQVIDYMVNSYKKGLTPNPDVMCNKHIKFGAFFNWALSKKVDYIATGHYAICKNNKLLKAFDQEKDQTYFLWTLKKEILKHTIFPIGHLTKTEVRKIAEENDLFTAKKSDSQGLCFLGHVDMKSFLKKYIETKPGKVLDENNKTIGEHEGAELYTIGERHGFRIFPEFVSPKPRYVIQKNINNNTITVSDRDLAKNSYKVVIITDFSFTNKEPRVGDILEARYRYRQELLKIKIEKIEDKKITIRFIEPINNVALGQSLVIYNIDECIGGGVISKLD